MDASALDKAISTLESSISSLESSADSLEFWLWASSVAVVVGVALELYFVVHEYRLQREAWQRASIRSPEKPVAWFFVFEMASVLLVVLGVAGELVVGIVSANKNAELRNKNGLLVALVREKAGIAEKEAQEAKERALRLDVKSLALQEQIVEMGPRDLLLSGQREEKLVKTLIAFRGQKVLIAFGQRGPFPLSDPEVRDTIKRIADILGTACGWMVTHGANGWPLEDKGIYVGTADNPSPSTAKAAKALVDALKAVPVLAELHDFNKDPFGKWGSKGANDIVDVIVMTNPARPAPQRGRILFGAF